MKVSSIGWTDFSGGDLNFVTGCTPVSEGCQNCYARAIYKRFGRDFGNVQYHDDKASHLWRQHWPEWSPKRGTGHPPMVFVCDTGDLFHPGVRDDQLYWALVRMASDVRVVWQILTKRPERMREALTSWKRNGLLDLSTKPHIWLGVTAENQARADERIPILLDTPAAVRFVSVEPCLSAVDLRPYLFRGFIAGPTIEPRRGTIGGKAMPTARLSNRLDWVICGAESGPNRRPFDIQWAQDLSEQCNQAGVPCFGKQGSGLRPGTPLFPWGRQVHEWPCEGGA